MNNDTQVKQVVKFSRGIENKYGDMEYVSKCGKYKIIRREYDLSIKSVGYRLFKIIDVLTAMHIDTYDTLAEAKEAANENARPGWLDLKYKDV